MGPKQLGRSKLERLGSVLSKVTLVAFLSLFPIGAFAAAVPTPAPGTATLIAAPTPNPADFNFQPNTTASSGQVNSNFYKVYSDLGNVLTQLNNTTAIGSSYTCPFCVTQLVTGGGLSSSTLSGASASGQTLTLVLGVVPVANGGTGSNTQNFVDLTTSQSIGGAKTFTSAGTTVQSLLSQGNIQSNNGVFVAPASTPIQVCPNNTCSIVFSTTGAASFSSQVTGSSTANGTVTFYPPMYSAAGAAAPSTTHSVFATCALVGVTHNCQIALTNNAVFTSAATAACKASEVSTSGLNAWSNLTSGTSISVFTSTGASGDTVAVVCEGY